MQNITDIANYSEIIASGNYSVEWAVDIGESGRLITHTGDYITFGSGDGLVRVLVSSAGADNGFREDILKNVSVTNAMFSGSPEIGKAVSGEVDVEMLMPEMIIPRMAAIRVFNRIFNDTLVSGWLEQGTYYIDTREVTVNIHGRDVIKLHGYDSMLMAEQPYTWGLSPGATDIQVVRDIVNKMQSYSGIALDERTEEIMTAGYTIQSEQVGQYTMREMLGYLAAAYAGSFIITPQNKLRLVQLVTVPPETNYLAINEGNTMYALTFGSGAGFVRILV